MERQVPSPEEAAAAAAIAAARALAEAVGIGAVFSMLPTRMGLVDLSRLQVDEYNRFRQRHPEVDAPDRFVLLLRGISPAFQGLFNPVLDQEFVLLTRYAMGYNDYLLQDDDLDGWGVRFSARIPGQLAPEAIANVAAQFTPALAVRAGPDYLLLDWGAFRIMLMNDDTNVEIDVAMWRDSEPIAVAPGLPRTLQADADAILNATVGTMDFAGATHLEVDLLDPLAEPFDLDPTEARENLRDALFDDDDDSDDSELPPPENNVNCVLVPRDAPEGTCQGDDEGEEVDFLTLEALRDKDAYVDDVLKVGPQNQCILRPSYDQLQDLPVDGRRMKTHPLTRQGLYCRPPTR